MSSLTSNLLAEEVKRDSHKRGSSSLSAKALYVSKGKPRKFRKNSPGGSLHTGQSSGSILQIKTKGTCNWCRILGHFEKECCKKLNGEPRKPPLEFHMLTTPSKPYVLVICSVHDACTTNAWFLDSGASHHVCFSRHQFQDYTATSENTFLIVGNNSRVAVVGIGTITLVTSQKKHTKT